MKHPHKVDSKIHNPLSFFTLEEDATDKALISKIGDAKKAETSLADVSNLIWKQQFGQTGVLITDGSLNLFFVRDRKGLLRSVHVELLGRSWFIGSLPVNDDRRREKGSRVFHLTPVQ
ncbi:MAG TPA: hypothetical protein VFT82_04170 [Candidatus Paceibacterota bacterium]|nr:hypothetical protein [Candidatus Paceibacterota bacterium]